MNDLQKRISFNVKEKCEELIYIIKNRFVRPDGLVARNYPVGERTIFDNFDDLAPFFIYFEETDFLLEQVRIIINNNENMSSLCGKNGMLLTRDLDEWFGGLYALWKETSDPITFRLLKESLDYVMDCLIQENFLSAGLYLADKTSMPFYEPWSSGLLETFCEMREDFPKPFEVAQKIMQNWLQDDYFVAYGLFPYRIFVSSVIRFFQQTCCSAAFPHTRYSIPPGYPPPKLPDRQWLHFYALNGRYSQLMKSNTTCAFTLLELFNATGDDFWRQNLLKWNESAMNNFFSSGKVYMEYVPRSGLKRDVYATSAFILADILCDSVYYISNMDVEIKSKYLATIKDILDYAWNNRLQNGLIPWMEEDSKAHLDSQVDFAISFRRYAQLADDPSSLLKSCEILNNAVREHYSTQGYFTYSGQSEHNVIDPKYNALLLKGMINLFTIDSPLYPKYHAVFKDR